MIQLRRGNSVGSKYIPESVLAVWVALMVVGCGTSHPSSALDSNAKDGPLEHFPEINTVQIPSRPLVYAMYEEDPELELGLASEDDASRDDGEADADNGDLQLGVCAFIVLADPEWKICDAAPQYCAEHGGGATYSFCAREVGYPRQNAEPRKRMLCLGVCNHNHVSLVKIQMSNAPFYSPNMMT